MLASALPETETFLPRLPLEPDLFGHVLMDYFRGWSTEYFLRRDDNYLERDNSARYFRSWEMLPAHQRCLLDHARGRVLDIGAGAGQHALPLQARGLDVVAIEASQLAIEVCHTRGVRDVRLMNAGDLQLEPASFDTALLLGNTLGIAGSPDGLRKMLSQLYELIRPGGQILADIDDYTATYETSHLRYHRWNQSRGRYPGSVNLRVEYDGKRGPQFDWLLTTLRDLRAALVETGWRMARCVQVNNEATYAIAIERI